MSTDRLRDAAAHVRLTTDQYPPGVGLALADWLDTAGADVWAHGPLCECGGGCMSCDDDAWQPHARSALRLADLILGARAEEQA